MEKRFKGNYQQWVGKDGLIHCPNCHTVDILHITIPYEGEYLICKTCKRQEKLGEEYQKKRGGLRL